MKSGIGRPAAIEEVEDRRCLEKVHVGAEVAVYGAYITPVGSIIGTDHFQRARENESAVQRAGEYVLPEVVGGFLLPVADQLLDEEARLETVYSEIDTAPTIDGVRGRIVGLFDELLDASSLPRADCGNL